MLLLLGKCVDHVVRGVDQRLASVKIPTAKDGAVKLLLTMPVVAKGWIHSPPNDFTL